MVGIYFSGTGNSRYAAEMFCNEYDEAAKAFSIEDDNVIQAVKNEEMTQIPLRLTVISTVGVEKSHSTIAQASLGREISRLRSK